MGDTNSTFPLKFKLSLTMMRDVELVEEYEDVQSSERGSVGAGRLVLLLFPCVSVSPHLFLIVATTVHPLTICKHNI